VKRVTVAAVAAMNDKLPLVCDYRRSGSSGSFVMMYIIATATSEGIIFASFVVSLAGMGSSCSIINRCA